MPYCVVLHTQENTIETPRVLDDSGRTEESSYSWSYSSTCARCRLFMLHTHPFNGPFSRTTQVSRYQKGKTKLDFTEARDSEWQWHQLEHMQVCTSLQTDNHANTPPLSFLQYYVLPLHSLGGNLVVLVVLNCE